MTFFEGNALRRVVIWMPFKVNCMHDTRPMNEKKGGGSHIQSICTVSKFLVDRWTLARLTELLLNMSLDSSH